MGWKGENANKDEVLACDGIFLGKTTEEVELLLDSSPPIDQNNPKKTVVCGILLSFAGPNLAYFTYHGERSSREAVYALTLSVCRFRRVSVRGYFTTGDVLQGCVAGPGKELSNLPSPW
jgi:hypothetical protein